MKLHKATVYYWADYHYDEEVVKKGFCSLIENDKYYFVVFHTLNPFGYKAEKVGQKPLDRQYILAPSNLCRLSQKVPACYRTVRREYR